MPGGDQISGREPRFAPAQQDSTAAQQQSTATRQQSASAQELFAEVEGVSRTLTIPLMARYLAGRRPDPIITDPDAGRLLAELGLSHLHGDWSFQAVEAGTAIRTELLDAAVRDLAEAHPGLSIVTLGAGLCTRCVRLHGIDATWVDLDLPPVAALRRALLPPEANRSVIANSVLSRDWHEAVADSPGPWLFILEGLTMYLHESEVRSLVTDLADRFPGSHVLIETVGPRSDPPGVLQQLRDQRTTGTEFVWSVRRHEQLCRWHPRLELLNTWYVMDYHAEAWPFLVRTLRHLPSVRAQSKIGHFRIAA